MENEFVDDLDLVTKEEKQVDDDECCGDPDCTCDDLLDEIVEDESLRNEDDGHGYRVGYTTDEGLIPNILCETALIAANELNFITQLGNECRQNLFDLIVKSDLDKEKITVRMSKLQDFLSAMEIRTDKLVTRIERLADITNKGIWTCMKSQ